MSLQNLKLDFKNICGFIDSRCWTIWKMMFIDMTNPFPWAMVPHCINSVDNNEGPF
jgi:hypothetical protein